MMAQNLEPVTQNDRFGLAQDCRVGNRVSGLGYRVLGRNRLDLMPNVIPPQSGSKLHPLSFILHPSI